MINKLLKTKYFKWLGYIIMLVVFGLCKEEEDVRPYNNIPYKHIGINKKLLDLTNSYREEKGLQLLHGDLTLYKIAKDRVDYQISIDSISHNGLVSTVKRFNIKSLIGFGENLGYKYRTPQGCFNGWLNSESHKRILDNPNWLYTGVFIKKDKGGNYHYVLIVGY